MTRTTEQLSITARQAARARDWRRVGACARELIRRPDASAEGHFLLGLAEKAARRPRAAVDAFRTACTQDAARYDAAVEAAAQLVALGRFGEAVHLVRDCESRLDRSPRYLQMAATVYLNAGLPANAWPLFRQADALQPGIDALRAGLAECSVYVGRIDAAAEIYRELLARNPGHQRNHYALSRLQRATDSTHLDAMRAILETNGQPDERNIYLLYAIGKECEDLGRWDEAFDSYSRAGAAAARVAGYDVDDDVRLVDAIIETCDADWLTAGIAEPGDSRTPVFVTGLPRSGTTLVERVLGLHSGVESAGETWFLQQAVRRVSGIESSERMTAAMIPAAARSQPGRIGEDYLSNVVYKLDGKPAFIEKFPENFLYLGFIAREFPNARIVHVHRHPMDNAFGLFRQSYFRYAYRLEDLAAFLPAWERLATHWRNVLGDRIVDVRYEDFVTRPDAEIRRLLAAVGLPFEEACLHVENNLSASNTASAVQVREPMHTRSIGHWRHFASGLAPLEAHLRAEGVELD